MTTHRLEREQYLDGSPEEVFSVFAEARTSRIEEWQPGRGFVDRQIRGPYRLWHHRHSFERSGAGTVVRDEVDYAMPLGALGELGVPLFVARHLERIFAYRHEAVPRLLS